MFKERLVPVARDDGILGDPADREPPGNGSCPANCHRVGSRKLNAQEDHGVPRRLRRRSPDLLVGVDAGPQPEQASSLDERADLSVAQAHLVELLSSRYSVLCTHQGSHVGKMCKRHVGSLGGARHLWAAALTSCVQVPDCGRRHRLSDPMRF